MIISGNTPGDTANYSCNPGFQMNGVAVLRCQSDGIWDSSPRLVLVCKYLYQQYGISYKPSITPQRQRTDRNVSKITANAQVIIRVQSI